VAAQEVEVGCAEAPCGTDEITLFYAQHNSAHQASRTRPSDHPDDHHNEEKGFERADGERQKSSERKKKIEPWTGEKRDLPPVENARELIAAVGVTAEETYSGARSSEDMQTGGDEAEQTVSGPAHKEVEWNSGRGVLFVLIKRTFSQTKRIEKGTEVQAVLSIHYVDAHGRKIGALAVLFVGIVWRKKSCTGHNAVEDD
jgi:hypothetical protein